jgi:hypothetical protein
MEPILNNNRIKRSVLARTVVGLGWFVLVNALFVFGLAEIVSLYANTVATGQEAINLDRALSKKLGGTVGLVFFVVSAILIARWSVSGFLPGTTKVQN